MKNTIRNLSGLTLLGVMLLNANVASAQTTTTVVPAASTTTTTTSDGTVSEFGPDSFVVRSTTSTTPLSYSYSKTTSYVDEDDHPVERETLKSGTPVTVYYTRDGDKMIASKVIVKKTTTTTVP